MADYAVQSDASSARGGGGAKVNDENGGDDGSQSNTQSNNSLCGFKVSNVLTDCAKEKRLVVRGKLADQDAVVILEATPFREETLAEIFKGSKLSLKPNNINSTFQMKLPPQLSEIMATVVCPATEEHIKKYQRQESFMVEETGADYQSITLPYIQEQSFSVQWVYNILEKKAEAERIVYEDPDPLVGFVLLPDVKWDQKEVDDLDMTAIVNQRNISSLRDLRAEHLPLLQNILKKGEEIILKRYNLPASKLCVYLHYLPSYYHLHVFFTNLDYHRPGCNVDQAHDLTDVIQHLQADPDYYKNRIITFLLSDDDLLRRFKQAGRL